MLFKELIVMSIIGLNNKKLYIEILTPDRFAQDGGCTCPGDVAKAIGAGADFVMLGGMLAGHDQVLHRTLL